MLNKDGVLGIEPIELSRKPGLANPNAESLQETKELVGLSPFIYFSFLIVLILSVYKTVSVKSPALSHPAQ